MKNNYLEKSLKRFLKRKVKVTLGLIISFLITGTALFAENKNDLEYLLQRNSFVNNDFCDGICPSGIGSNHDDLKVTSAVEIYDKIYHNHGSIERTVNWAAVALKGDNQKFYNYGYLFGGGNVIDMKNATNTVEAHNYGKVETNGTAIVRGSDNGKSFFYNHGTAVLKSDKGNPLNIFAGNNLEAYNFGSIISLRGENNTLDNPNLTFKKDGYTFTNYGYLNTYKIMMQLAEKEQLFNNGIIKTESFVNSGAGSTPSTENTVSNKGIFIMGKETFDKSNNELVNMWEVFNNNRGAVLRKETDGKYTLLNPDDIEKGLTNGTDKEDKEKDKIINTIKAHGTVKDMSNETIINKDTILGYDKKEADNLFINDKSLTLNLGKEISGKVITAVSQTEGNVVLNNDTDGDKVSGNLSLNLDNTYIIGYFEKDGTLLKVDGDLTLKNGSIINAVAARDEDGNILADAVAVDVTGKLTYTAGESNIYGTIKGGEKSQITVKGEGNKTNDLNENLETSGEVNLLNGDWTKGLGKITLDGTDAVVNIDKGNGNLTGYLYGNSQDAKTTLDGMIEGNGTLNVNKIKFDMGNLEIGSLNDTYTVDGNGDVTLEGVSDIQGVLNKIDVSGIFNKDIQGSNIILTFKTAEEMGIHDEETAKKYEELVKNFKDDEEKYNLINKGDAYEIRKYLGVIDAVMELLGTTGVKITRDLTGAFTNAVNEFDKKADKGEWLTSAKYINSDMEYDGTKTVNGYDSDINSMIGMAEYGITENTSVGFALGGGDTKIDLKHPEKKSTSFDGKNYYAGIYTKHSVNGFDMTGSLGYTVSDLDVDNGGSADSEAFTLAGYIKRDIKLSDTVKLQPNLSFIYDYIMQDTAEMGEGMTIDSGDYHVFEGGAGVNLVKEFVFEKGILKLETGIKYSMTNVERNQEITGKFYSADVNLGSPDIDDKKGTAHVGFDFENVKGFGVNTKYETMWSDSGDDNRITAGISYRF